MTTGSALSKQVVKDSSTPLLISFRSVRNSLFGIFDKCMPVRVGHVDVPGCDLLNMF